MISTPYQIGELIMGYRHCKVGDWQCEIDWQGEVVRRFEMTVEYDGRIQVDDSTQLNGPSWPVKLKIIDSVVENGKPWRCALPLSHIDFQWLTF